MINYRKTRMEVWGRHADTNGKKWFRLEEYRGGAAPLPPTSHIIEEFPETIARLIRSREHRGATK